MPRRSAAVAPSTTAGRPSVASSSQRPCARPPRPAACPPPTATRMPPVIALGTRSVRRTEASRPSTADTDCTAPTRRSIPGASSGSTAWSPKIDCRAPASAGSCRGRRAAPAGRPVTRTRSRPRPRARRCRWRCPAPRARRAAAASAGRGRRPRRRRARAAGWPGCDRRRPRSQRRLADRPVAGGVRRRALGVGVVLDRRRSRRLQGGARRVALVLHDLAVEQGDAAGMLAASSRSCVMTTIDEPEPCRSRSRSMTAAPERLSRLPVGSSARISDGSPTRARAIATRCRSPPESFEGRCRSRWPRPTRSSARLARAPPLALRRRPR